MSIDVVGAKENNHADVSTDSNGPSRTQSTSSLTGLQANGSPHGNALLQQDSKNSSTSSFSRASSVRSTDSVQAAVVKAPLKISTPSVSRAASYMQYTPYFTRKSLDYRVNANGNLSTSNSPSTPPLSLANSPRFRADEILPPTLPSGLHAPLPDFISTAPPTGISLPTPTLSTFAQSRPPTPSAIVRDNMMLRPVTATKGGNPLSRSASSASMGVIVRRNVSDFEFGDILGEGSYSTVYLVSDKHPPHREYALKILDKRHIVKEKKQKYVNIEKDTLNRLERHPGIVRLYWTFHDERSLYFVLQVAKNGEILDYIKQYGSFDLTCATYYAAQLLSAIEHMHSRGVIHRDIKPENILLDHNMRIKVTDFGTAKLLEKIDGDQQGVDDRGNSFVGTAEYVSPELLTSKTAFRSSDFWAFGCVLYQFLAGKPPFKAPTEYLTFKRIIDLQYSFPDDFPAQAKDLVEKLLIRDPAMRLGAKGVDEIKQHPFFNSIDFATIWTTETPPLQSGIVPAPVRREMTFEIHDEEEYFTPAAIQSDSHDQPVFWQPPQTTFHHHAGVESIDSSASSAEKVLSNVAGIETVRAPSKLSEETQRSRWTSYLLPDELVTLSAIINDRSGLFSKKRLLILSDYPRLLLAREYKTRLKIKHEIFIGRKNDPNFNSKDDNSKKQFTGATEVLLDVRLDGTKGIRVFTSARSYRFEDPDGQAQRWVDQIKHALVLNAS